MVKVVLTGSPDWGKKFTRLVCEAWYRRKAQEGEEAEKDDGEDGDPAKKEDAV